MAAYLYRGKIVRVDRYDQTTQFDDFQVSSSSGGEFFRAVCDGCYAFGSTEQNVRESIEKMLDRSLP